MTLHGEWEHRQSVTLVSMGAPCFAHLSRYGNPSPSPGWKVRKAANALYTIYVSLDSPCDEGYHGRGDHGWIATEPYPNDTSIVYDNIIMYDNIDPVL